MVRLAKTRLLIATLLSFTLVGASASAQRKATSIQGSVKSAVNDAAPSSSVLLDAMTGELQRAFTSLGKAGPSQKDADKQLPPYFLSYSVADATSVSIRAQYGALADSTSNQIRVADVQVRIGDPKLDNTHGGHRGSAVNSLQMPLGDDRAALARTLWLATNAGYGTALENYLRVKTEAQVRAKEEDTSPDFSKESPQVSISKPAPAVVVDRAAWEQRVKALSADLPRLPRCLSEPGDAHRAERDRLLRFL